jgi:hypothetical protein
MIKRECWVDNENPSKNNEILSAPGWLHKARRIDISKRGALKNPHEKEMINKQNIKHFISVKYADYLSIVSNDRYYDWGMDTLHYSATEVVSVALIILCPMYPKRVSIFTKNNAAVIWVERSFLTNVFIALF